MKFSEEDILQSILLVREIMDNIFDIDEEMSPQLREKLQEFSVLDGKTYSITEIKEKKFKNLSGERWLPNCKYISHPMNPNNYIEESCFKDFILREMLNDVANYILDNFGVSVLVIGIVVNKDYHGELGMAIPVCNINTEAKLNVSVSQDYTVRGNE